MEPLFRQELLDVLFVLLHVPQLLVRELLSQRLQSSQLWLWLLLPTLTSLANGITEIGGPEAFRLPDLIRTALTARGDSREVVADLAARYWGIEIGERTLCPGDGATLFDTRFEDWILEAAAKA